MSDLLAKGDASLDAGNAGRAVHFFKKVLAASQENDQSRGAAYQRLGRAYAALDLWNNAATCYEEAAAIAHNLGQRFVAYELQAYHQVSQVYQALALATPIGPDRVKAYQKAQSAAETMLDLARREGNGLAECMAWTRLGKAQQGLGDYKSAAESTGNAVTIAHEAKDMVAAADYLADLGYTELLAGHVQEAGRHYEKGLSLLKSPHEHPFLTARLRDGLAEIHLVQGRTTIARLHAERAVNLAHQAQNPYLEALHRSTLGRVFTRLGEYENAAGQHQTAIDLLQRVRGNRAYLDLAGEWGNLATLLRLLGRYQSALEALAEALDVAVQTGDRLAEGKWQDTLGSVYEELGDLEAAERCHRQALQIFEELGHNDEAAEVHNNLGTTFYRRGLFEVDDRFFEQAAEHFRHARDGAQRAGDQVMAANATGNLGIIYLRTGKPKEAVEAFKEARDTLQAAGRNLEAGHQFENLGLAHGEYLGDPERALGYFDQAIQIARDCGDTDGLRIALTRLGDLYRKQRTVMQVARGVYEEAISLLESEDGGRPTLSLSAHRGGILARSLDAYEGLIQLDWQDSDFEAAFNWAERARARAFLEQFGLSASLSTEGLPSRLVEQERALIRQTREIEQQVTHIQDTLERTRLTRQRRELQEALENLWDEMAALPGGERYVTMRRGAPATANSLQGWLDDHPSDTAVVAYYTLPDAIYAWIFRSGQPVQGMDIPIGQTALGRYLGVFEREVSGYWRYGLSSNTWEEKLAPLVVPLRPYLDGIHSIYLAPHGRLHGLPLHALPIDNEPLGEAFAVTYTPNAGVLLRHTAVASISPHDSVQALALGFTPHKREAGLFAGATTEMAAFLDTRPYLGRAASSRRLKREVATADLIYILCHGEFDRRSPLDSCLHLADGPLTARDILTMDLSGALVILTACDVGTTQVNPGDELIGLSHAFLIAGASAVLAARWTVEAISAIRLVEEFYAHWRYERASLAAALQQAMRVVRHHRQPDGNQPYAHPYYWAPFTLVGKAD